MDTTRLIEDYLEGNLSETEKREVDERADTDPAFSKLIELHREVNESITDSDLYELHQKVITILSNENEYHRKGYRRLTPLFRIAAFLILIAGSIAVLSILLTGSREERLYKKFYKPYEADIITRDGISGDELSQALIYYNQNDYSQAFSLFTQITVSDPNYHVAWFFRGITCMQLDNFEEALNSFAAIPGNWNNPYNEHRNWYQALALLHENNIPTAIEKFQEISKEKGFYSHDSEAILAALEK